MRSFPLYSRAYVVRRIVPALVLATAATFSILAVLGHGTSAAATACYFGVLFGVGAATVLRGVVTRRERGVWLLVGAAQLSWSAGFLYWRLRYEHASSPPTPSISDGLELSAYPMLFVALVLLTRARLRVSSLPLWLDGAAAALAAGAIGAVIMAGPLRGLTGGSAGAVITGLAYPAGDFLLVGLATGVLAVRGRALGRTWALFLLGGLVFAATDCVSLYQSLNGSYSSGSSIDIGWMVGTLLIGFAAWQPAEDRTTIDEGRHSVALPVGLGSVCLGVLLSDHFEELGVFAVCAAALSLAVILVRFVLTFALSRRLLLARGREALTDSLTKLGNRRAMVQALDATLAAAADRDEKSLLAIFDLDGFKAYNDGFGHLAGDLLLTRVSRRLRVAAEERGATAYRMGGDEFCVFGPESCGPGPEQLIAWGTAALTEQGDGFTITASGGHTVVDAHTVDASAALSEADERMYGVKRSQRTSALTQVTAVLRAVEHAADPELAQHTGRVAQLALRVARRMGMPELELRWIGVAAELHDIGKLAIPAAIFSKPASLDGDEWAFIRRHTLIGEHIARSAEVLGAVAPLIRSSHERWDGAGYPDGLAGEAIPLGAQIIFVCDAFAAMTSERPYRRALPVSVALAELAGAAGTQFAPAVVEAFVACWAADGESATAVAVGPEGFR